MCNCNNVRVVSLRCAEALVAILLTTSVCAAVSVEQPGFTLEQATAYPFVDHLVSAAAIDRVAWVRMVGGVRNIFVADVATANPRQVTQFTADDGQELTQLTFSANGEQLVFVRGGDHDSNWPAPGGLQPNPASSAAEPKIALWLADPLGNTPARKLVDGDAPALSATGQLAYIHDHQVWTAPLDGQPGARLFFDRGQDGALSWSPDGQQLAFVSHRGDHAFIGVYTGEDRPLHWLVPSTGFDGHPIWSEDGKKLAFIRLPGEGGPPPALLKRSPAPWAIWSVDVATGAGHAVWNSPETLRGSYPDVAGEANLHWAGNDQLTFLSEVDNWPHLYVVAEKGGEAHLLTPGPFMVEHVAVSKDGRSLVYSANTGTTADDDDRRHLFRVGISGGAPTPLTRGESLEWSPVTWSAGVAFIGADARNPGAVHILPYKGATPKPLPGQAPPATFAGARFITPKQVTWTAPDGLLIHGQLFQQPDGVAAKPGVIFVHGGPPRQMLLGWSYMRYYANAYAVNQYLAAHGFVVLSVNYRLGIGYGYDFQHPANAGWTGSSEYQDVAAGGRYLAGLPGVDPQRIGIWGGSYGGLLTALGLARDSDLFKAGVDIHGVHDWSRDIGFDESNAPRLRYEKSDLEEALAVAFKASPVADIDRWTSPVMLIHGDDDRNVHIGQTIDLARRLRDHGITHEELIIPDDIHDFLRDANWAKVDAATVDFLTRKLGAQ